ncbi:MAG TPA: BrnT family toxin [Beijerinckiaceae bacterium]|jgi:hypothetical protein|nr:BrnT family toxin [Beijerinckiaceae bacterium]
MEFGGFEWDAGNVEKCRKHGVSIVEIESLFLGQPFIGPDPQHSQSERRFRAAGRTASGRALFVVFTWRTRSEDKLLRPISARYMHSKEIEVYEARKKEIS